MEKEYLMLRNEMLKDYDIIQNSRYLLYVAVASMLSFSFTQNETLLFLVPYIVIIPTYLVSIDYTLDMYRICTYLMVFHEPGDFNWEIRQYEFNYVIDRKIPRRFKFFHFPFIGSSLACSILFFCYTNYPADLKSLSIKFIVEMIISVFLFLNTIVIFAIYNNMPKFQKKYRIMARS